MKHTFIKGALLSAALVSTTVTAAELETEAQKLGYIIGMDIGNSLKEQGTPMDIDTLLEASSLISCDDFCEYTSMVIGFVASR